MRSRFCVAVIRTGILIVLGGCRISSQPTGGGYPSVIATNVLRLAMLKAYGKADLSVTSGRTVSVFSTGFDKDERGAYLRLLTRNSVISQGGRIVDEDPQLTVEIIVDVAGIDVSDFIVPPFWISTQTDARLAVDLVVRGSDGQVLHEQRLRGDAKYDEPKLLMFISLPPRYFVRYGDNWRRIRDPFISSSELTDGLHQPVPWHERMAIPAGW